MSESTSISVPAFLEFRLKFTHASTAIGSVYYGKVKLMDFICNLNCVIPEGFYSFSFYDSPKFKREVLLLSVPDYSYIEVHPADWSYELIDCFAVGSIEGWQDNPKKSYSKLFAASDSNKWLDKLIDYVKRAEINHIMFVHSECIKVYLTGRG